MASQVDHGCAGRGAVEELSERSTTAALANLHMSALWLRTSAADIVRIDNERLRCKQCGQAFTPPSAERGSEIGFNPDLCGVTNCCYRLVRRAILNVLVRQRAMRITVLGYRATASANRLSSQGTAQIPVRLMGGTRSQTCNGNGGQRGGDALHPRSKSFITERGRKAIIGAQGAFSGKFGCWRSPESESIAPEVSPSLGPIWQLRKSPWFQLSG